MEKNKWAVLLAAVLVSALAVFIAMSVMRGREQRAMRQSMMNHAYSELTTISLDLGGLAGNVRGNITSYETNVQVLIQLSHYFITLDSVLERYAYYFDSEKLNYRGSIFDFDYIAYTLTAGTGSANGMSYSGIIADGEISDKEVEYLSALKSDIDVIIAGMVSADNPPQEDSKLTINRVNMLLDAFFEKWNYHNESSPYFLLVQ